MLRLEVADSLTDAWSPVLARHYQLRLAACAADLRSLVVAFAVSRGAHEGFECRLRGRYMGGGSLEVRASHVEGETAIELAFARAHREIRRRRRLSGFGEQPGAREFGDLQHGGMGDLPLR
ncbi:MAG: hypothetical protein KF911_10165 [Pseudomonadales bacterium]|nr:hypothetical protein [Pseudomonadales bacterium]